MRIESELVLHQSGQRVMPATKIDGTHGEHDPQPLRRNDHAPRSNAVMISAMRVDAVSCSNRSTTLPTTISIFASLSLRTDGCSSSISTNSAGPGHERKPPGARLAAPLRQLLRVYGGRYVRLEDMLSGNLAKAQISKDIF